MVAKRHRSKEARAAERARVRAYVATSHGYLTSKRAWFRSELRRLYGITVEDFAWLWERANHACEICRRELTLDSNGLTGRRNVPHVDHCHATGEVRGILCQDCNHGLGEFKDDRTILRRAIGYLDRYGSDRQGGLFDT